MLEARNLGLDHEAHVVGLGNTGLKLKSLSLLMYVVKKLPHYLQSSFQQLRQCSNKFYASNISTNNEISTLESLNSMTFPRLQTSDMWKSRFQITALSTVSTTLSSYKLCCTHQLIVFLVRDDRFPKIYWAIDDRLFLFSFQNTYNVTTDTARLGLVRFNVPLDT